MQDLKKSLWIPFLFYFHTSADRSSNSQLLYDYEYFNNDHDFYTSHHEEEWNGNASVEDFRFYSFEEENLPVVDQRKEKNQREDNVDASSEDSRFYSSSDEENLYFLEHRKERNQVEDNVIVIDDEEEILADYSEEKNWIEDDVIVFDNEKEILVDHRKEKNWIDDDIDIFDDEEEILTDYSEENNWIEDIIFDDEKEVDRVNNKQIKHKINNSKKDIHHFTHHLEKERLYTVDSKEDILSKKINNGIIPKEDDIVGNTKEERGKHVTEEEILFEENIVDSTFLHKEDEILLEDDDINKVVQHWFDYRTRMNRKKCNVPDEEKEICNHHIQFPTKKECIVQGCCYDPLIDIGNKKRVYYEREEIEMYRQGCYRQKILSPDEIDITFHVADTTLTDIDLHMYWNQHQIAQFTIDCSLQLEDDDNIKNEKNVHHKCISNTHVTHFRFKNKMVPLDYINPHVPYGRPLLKNGVSPYFIMEIVLHTIDENHPDIDNPLEAGRSYVIGVKDHEDEQISFVGKVGDPKSTKILRPTSHHQSRRLQNVAFASMHTKINQSIESFIGWRHTEQLGFQRSCIATSDPNNKRRCPQRWSDSCWKNTIKEIEADSLSAQWADTIDMLTLSVFIFLDKSLCDEFKTEQICIDFVYGIFSEANSVYEKQIGLHLKLKYIATPSIIEEYFPQLRMYKLKDHDSKIKWLNKERILGNYNRKHRKNHIMGQVILRAMERILGKVKGKCEYSKTVALITGGLSTEDFSLFHLIHRVPNLKMQHSTMKGRTDGVEGIAFVKSVCRCASVGMTRIFIHKNEEFVSPPWTTFAHEIGHNLGMLHTFKNNGLLDKNKAGGVMDYGNAKSHEIYQFSDYHQKEICPFLRQMLLKHWGRTTCFVPHYVHSSRDPRIFSTVHVMIIIFSPIVFCLLWCFCCCEIYSQKRKLRNYEDLVEKNEKLIEEDITEIDNLVYRHNNNVSEIKNLQNEIEILNLEKRWRTEPNLNNHDEFALVIESFMNKEVMYKESLETTMSMEVQRRMGNIFLMWSLRYKETEENHRLNLLKNPWLLAKQIFDNEFRVNSVEEYTAIRELIQRTTSTPWSTHCNGRE